MSDYWGSTPQQPEQPGQPGQPQSGEPQGGQPTQPVPQPPEVDRWGAPTQSQPEVLSSHAGAEPTAAYPISNPTTYLGAGDILGAPQPAPRGGGKGKLAAIGIGVVAVAGIGVGAAFAAGAFSKDSAQPETLVPASSVAYVSIDLDPSLGQKVDALRFLRKFPSAKASLGSTDDLREWVFDQAVKDDDSLSQLNYDRDVKPWIGDKFGVAVVPAAQAGAEPNAVIVLQVTDEAKAKAGLKKLIKDPSDGTCAVAKGYALCAETPAILSAAQSGAAKSPLSSDAHFTSDVDAAGDRGIVLAWGDLGKVAKLVPDASAALGNSLGAAGGGLGGLSSLGGASSLSGRFVASVRFEGANLEVTGKTIGGKAAFPTTSQGTDVENLPNNTMVAFGGALAPKAIDTAYAQIKKQLGSLGGADMMGGVESQLDQLGFHLPQDIDALIGTKFDIAYGGMGSDGMPLVGIRSNTDAAKAGAVLDRVSDQLSSAGAPFAIHHASASKGYAAALTEAYAKQLAAGGHLGDQSAFKSAVPDANVAAAVFYVDLARLFSDPSMSAAFGGSVDPNVKALSAFGMSAKSESSNTASFHLKVTTR